MRNLNDFIVFAHVVDHKGFAPAARALNVPKSTLSKRVAELEKTLGVRLINRTSRRFTVTEIGEDFYRHASAMLIEAEAAEAIVKGRLAEPSGTVRITASVPTAQMMLAGLLPPLAQAYPKMRVMLHATDRFVDVVQEGFDIAPLPDSGMVQRRVANDAILLVAAPAYLENRGHPREPSDLSRHDGLLASLTSEGWTMRNDAGVVVRVRPMPRFLADESSVLLEAAVSGLGITALPRKICRAAIEAGSLVRVLADWEAGSVTTTLLMPHRRGQLPSVRAVVDFIVTHLPGE